jgi:gp16 family phage-associated protein
MKTVQEVREFLRAEGMTIAAWARKHGYRAIQVYRVLDGHNLGTYGTGHEIAVKLGLKDAPKRASLKPL